MFNKDQNVCPSGNIAYRNPHSLPLWYLHHCFLKKQSFVLEGKLLFSNNCDELWWFEKLFSQLRERLINANKIHIEVQPAPCDAGYEFNRLKFHKMIIKILKPAASL